MAPALFDLLKKRMLRSLCGSMSCQGRSACVPLSTETDSAHRSSHRPAVHIQPGILGHHRRGRPRRRTSECRHHCQLAGSNRAAESAHNTPPGKPTIFSNSSKRAVGYRSRATSGAVISKTESDVFPEAIIGSMMSIQRFEAAGAMPSESSSSSEPEKPTILETTTERLFL